MNNLGLLLFVFVIIKFRGSFAELYNKIVSTPFGTNYNFIPFHSIGYQLAHFSEGWAKFNLLGNILPFLPFGFLLPSVYHKINTTAKMMITAILFVVFLELFQFFSRLGSFDIDDVILNTFGIYIGYLVKRIGK